MIFNACWMESMDFHWFLLIIIDFHIFRWFLWIFNDFRRCSLICVDFRWSSSIFVDVRWSSSILIDFHWFAGKPIKQKSEETYLAFRSFDSFQRKNTWNERWLLININYWEQRKGSERNTPEIFGVIAGEQNENKMCLSQGLC